MLWNFALTNPASSSFLSQILFPSNKPFAFQTPDLAFVFQKFPTAIVGDELSKKAAVK